MQNVILILCVFFSFGFLDWQSLAGCQDKEAEILKIEIVHGTKREKNGWDLVLRKDGIADLRGNRISDQELAKLLSAPMKNDGKKESVLFIQIEKSGNVGVDALAGAIKKIKSNRNPKLPTYVFIDFSDF